MPGVSVLLSLQQAEEMERWFGLALRVLFFDWNEILKISTKLIHGSSFMDIRQYIRILEGNWFPLKSFSWWSSFPPACLSSCLSLSGDWLFLLLNQQPLSRELWKNAFRNCIPKHLYHAQLYIFTMRAMWTHLTGQVPNCTCFGPYAR